MLLRLGKIAGVLGSFLLFAVMLIALIPPWWGKSAYMIHLYTSIPYRFQAGWPPQHFSGVWRDYKRDGSYDELSYKDGRRNGSQRYYDKTGHLVRSCEFKEGDPWSGLCDFWEHKPWLAEYRDGKVWKGAMQEYDDKQGDYVMRYYFEGKLYDEKEFRRRMGFGDSGSLVGIMCVRSRPR